MSNVILKQILYTLKFCFHHTVLKQILRPFYFKCQMETKKDLLLKFEGNFLFKRQLKNCFSLPLAFTINFMFERQTNIFEKLNDPWSHMFIPLYSDVFVVL